MKYGEQYGKNCSCEYCMLAAWDQRKAEKNLAFAAAYGGNSAPSEHSAVIEVAVPTKISDAQIAALPSYDEEYEFGCPKMYLNLITQARLMILQGRIDSDASLRCY